MTPVESSCPHCGAAVSANAKFCPMCGKTLELAAQAAPPLPTGQAVLISSQATCPHCGTAVSDNAKFCRTCGKTIASARACPHCSAALSPTAQFCGACGKPVAPVPAQRPATRAAVPLAQVPRAAKQPATPAARRSRPKGGLIVVSGCVAVLMLCLISVVGVYFVFQSGAITQETLLNLVGLGPATIEVMNFRDDAIQADITPLRESKEGTTEEESGHTFALKSFDVVAYRALNPGKYRIDLQPMASKAASGTCLLTVRGGDKYLFIVLRNGIMVDRLNAPPNSGSDLVFERSTLCR